MSEPGAEPKGLTYAQFAELPDDGLRYQLVEGEPVVTPSPDSWHQEIAGEIYFRLRLHVDEGNSGEVFVAPLDVVLDERTALQPDVLYVSDARRGILERGRVVIGAPDLVVEVLSPGTLRLDRVRKLELYARFGVPYCWTVDPEARRIEEYASAGDVYRVLGVTAFEDAFRPAALPGFTLRLGELKPPALPVP
jgi:Uma2 family endonuclease